MLDIISIGSATKDVFLISKGFKIIKSRQFKTGYGECFAYGAKVELGDIHFDTGGGATNSACTFKNLGLQCGLITRIGNDTTGEEIYNSLKKKGIDVSNVITDKSEKTAYSTILLTIDGERTILVYRGVSDNFIAKDFKSAELKAKWIYLTSLGGNLKALKTIFKIARENNIKIAWNPGSAELALPKLEIKKLIKQTELLLLNRDEAASLINRPVSSLVQIIRGVNELGANYWAISDGSNGAYVSDLRSIYFAPALKINVVNATGAGDAFGSGLVTGMIKKLSLKESLKLGILNAAGTISQMGAKHGLLEEMPSQRQFSLVKIKEIK